LGEPAPNAKINFHAPSLNTCVASESGFYWSAREMPLKLITG
jgi:hypothetical protein